MSNRFFSQLENIADNSGDKIPIIPQIEGTRSEKVGVRDSRCPGNQVTGS